MSLTDDEIHELVKNVTRERKSWAAFNAEFQYLWDRYRPKFGEPEENLAKYASGLETLILNFLERNGAKDPNVKGGIAAHPELS